MAKQSVRLDRRPVARLATLGLGMPDASLQSVLAYSLLGFHSDVAAGLRALMYGMT